MGPRAGPDSTPHPHSTGGANRQGQHNRRAQAGAGAERQGDDQGGFRSGRLKVVGGGWGGGGRPVWSARVVIKVGRSGLRGQELVQGGGARTPCTPPPTLTPVHLFRGFFDHPRHATSTHATPLYHRHCHRHHCCPLSRARCPRPKLPPPNNPSAPSASFPNPKPHTMHTNTSPTPTPCEQGSLPKAESSANFWAFSVGDKVARLPPAG
jgi:hypothetical protein